MFEIGNNLREARLRRRVDLVEAEQDTKIRSKYLAALEAEEFDVLPGPVYTRGFLRTYARYLGLDAQRHVDEYDTRFGRFHEEEALQPVLGRTVGTRRRPTLRMILVASLITLALLTWVGMRHDTRRVDVPGARLPAAADGGPEASGMAGGEDVRGAGMTAADSGRETEIRRSNGRSARAATVAASRPVGAVRLRVRAADGPSWIEVHRGTIASPVAWSGTMRVGTQRQFAGRRLTVVVGFPAAVRLSSGRHQLAPQVQEQRVYVVTARGIMQQR